MASANNLILDFDQSVLPLPGAARLPLGEWQEAIRFGCTLKTLAKLQHEISLQQSFSSPANILPDPAGAGKKSCPAVFLGSGDYHHVSHLLIQRYARLGQSIQVVVLDNHPDNMRYPFGIHCGSWVNAVSRLPFVRCVHVLGITSTDVEIGHAWENHLQPLRAGKVRYWCVGRKLAWMRYLGIALSQSFESMTDLLCAFDRYFRSNPGPVYLSIDKDVLSSEEVHTNWDQGAMLLQDLGQAIGLLKLHIIGCDVTGEVSFHRYESRFKRLLSRLDAQPEVTAQELVEWQLEHQRVNRQLLAWLN